MGEQTPVILNPHSNTNPSDDYLVVTFTDWQRFIDGQTVTLTIAGRYATYQDAREG